MDDPMLAAAVIGFIMGVACSGLIFSIGILFWFRKFVKLEREMKMVCEHIDPQIVIKGEVI